jgi:hypothetical protein
MMVLSLENPAYVEQTKAKWRRCLPKGMNVIEFCGAGDPCFGGNADDRPLGINGLILERGSNEPRAEFKTIEEAHEAAKAVRNRRPNTILGVLPWWR